MLQKERLEKALIIRFSSFGDIVQASFAAESLLQKNYSSVDLLTKSDFSKAFSLPCFPYNNVFAFEKNSSLSGLWHLSKICNQKRYALIYDAHNNQRSFLFKTFLVLQNPLNFLKFKTRSKFRLKRFFLFNFRINFFPEPFRGAESFLEPLKLRLQEKTRTANTEKNILLAPSAAWSLKKWPETYWTELALALIKTNFKVSFIGGPEDTFIEKIQEKVPESINLSGKMTWTETIQKINDSSLLIAGDTGVLHIADYLKTPAIALMGPSAFGTPSRKSTYIFNKKLKCQPCSKDGRGNCRNKIFKDCLISISPDEVIQQSLKKLGVF